MSLCLDSRQLHGRAQGGSGRSLPQRKLMCTLGGSLREKQKRSRREEKRSEAKRREEKRRGEESRGEERRAEERRGEER